MSVYIPVDMYFTPARAEKLRAKKKKKVNTRCSQKLQMNRAFSGGGVKVSAASISLTSDDTQCRYVGLHR